MAYTTIDDPSEFFQTKLYTGTGSSLALTNDGNSDLQPDWVWAKRRDGTYSHAWFDSSRGSTKRIISNLANTEDTNAQYITSFDSDGFTAGTDANINQSSLTYVAWQWKANGGTTSSNSDGGITTTVQANTTAGFSIITYEGTFSSTSIGHGLNSAPEWLIFKNRESTDPWALWHVGLNFPTDDLIYFNTNGANQHDPSFLNTAPSSSVITLGAYENTNQDNNDLVCYAFHSVKGYSKFGKYIGNGNADGAFVYTGFKPAWVMVKRTNSTGYWVMFDNTRQTENENNSWLLANDTSDEGTNSTGMDFVSNGFKLRNSSTASVHNNISGSTYIYMAFAEHPFVSSKGVPVTAR